MNWLEYTGVVGGLLVILGSLLVVERVHRRGNRQTRLLAPDSAFAHLYVGVSFTLVPSIFGVSFAILVATAYGLETATGSAFFGWILLVGAGGIFLSLGWAIKEYVRPSEWRRVPTWVYEQGLLERPHGSR